MPRTLPKIEVEEDVNELGRQRIATVFDRYDVPVVSFSGGKDSTVVLNLSMEEAEKRRQDGRLPPDFKLDVVYWDREIMHPDTIDYLHRVAANPALNFQWVCIPLPARNACSRQEPFWWPWNPEKRPVWVRQPPPFAITEIEGSKGLSLFDCIRLLYPREAGRTVGLMLGIRTEESVRRYRSVTARVEDNWLSPAPNAPWIQQAKPIYDWRWSDVWTAPLIGGWDYNTAYDHMAKLGIPPSRQRVGPPFGVQAMQTLWMWRDCWPDLWDKMLIRVPGVATAGRYALTPVYGGRKQKNPGETWEEAVLRVLMLWKDPEYRRALAMRAKQLTRQHEKITPGVPIPGRKPHIDLVRGVSSGVTWGLILQIITRGDTTLRLGPKHLKLEEINAARAAAWGEDWTERHPEIAARTKWNAKEGRWLRP